TSPPVVAGVAATHVRNPDPRMAAASALSPRRKFVLSNEFRGSGLVLPVDKRREDDLSVIGVSVGHGANRLPVRVRRDRPEAGCQQPVSRVISRTLAWEVEA